VPEKASTQVAFEEENLLGLPMESHLNLQKNILRKEKALYTLACSSCKRTNLLSEAITCSEDNVTNSLTGPQKPYGKQLKSLNS
jgi:hypothetical protein